MGQGLKPLHVSSQGLQKTDSERLAGGSHNHDHRDGYETGENVVDTSGLPNVVAVPSAEVEQGLGKDGRDDCVAAENDTAQSSYMAVTDNEVSKLKVDREKVQSWLHKHGCRD